MGQSGQPSHHYSYQHLVPGSGAFLRKGFLVSAMPGRARQDAGDGPPQELLDSGEAGIEGNHSFFDGDGSDEGLFS
jgi:hypothetical protein